ncbi:hypothetical protein GOB57_23895 [Sinorhizobium meliloti]|nr:hypothetical protein [Sinorhizobium meliloti]
MTDSRSDGHAALERIVEAAKAIDLPDHGWAIQNGSPVRIGTNGEDGNVLRRSEATEGFSDIVVAGGVLPYLIAAQPCEMLKVADLVADLEKEIGRLKELLGKGEDTSVPALAENELVSLRELRRYRGPYWWRQASMKKLLAMGLVETWHPDGKVIKRMAHRLTKKGIDALAEIDGRK